MPGGGYHDVFEVVDLIGCAEGRSRLVPEIDDKDAAVNHQGVQAVAAVEEVHHGIGPIGDPVVPVAAIDRFVATQAIQGIVP